MISREFNCTNILEMYKCITIYMLTKNSFRMYLD
jgi:hypothetical protein